MKRFREEGEAGFEDRSSRPHNGPNHVPGWMKERIVSDRITEKAPSQNQAGSGPPRTGGHIYKYEWIQAKRYSVC